MGFDLIDLDHDRRPVEVRYQFTRDGQLHEAVIQVTYAPSRIDGRIGQAIRAAIEQPVLNIELPARLLSQYMTSWDVTRDGAPIPITEEDLLTVSTELLGAIMVAINEDMSVGKSSAPNSGAGSAASPASPPSGTSSFAPVATSESRPTSWPVSATPGRA